MGQACEMTDGLPLIEFQSGYWVGPDASFYSTKKGGFHRLSVFKIHRTLYVNLAVRLSDGKRSGRQHSVSLLVAQNHVPNPKKYSHYIHVDRDVENCNADNLVWVESTLPYSGNNLTTAQVRAIEMKYREFSSVEVAEAYGVPREKVFQIWSIARRKGRIG